MALLLLMLFGLMLLSIVEGKSGQVETIFPHFPASKASEVAMCPFEGFAIIFVDECGVAATSTFAFGVAEKDDDDNDDDDDDRKASSSSK